MDRKKENLLFEQPIDWKVLGECSKNILDKVKFLGNPKRILIDLRLPSEFGENLSNKEIFKIIDQEYSKDGRKVVDICLTYVKEGYVIVSCLKL